MFKHCEVFFLIALLSLFLISSYDCSNPIYGQTLNPHNLQKTSGGSSGGEGALVGGGGSVLGIGSDIGGSIRIPASFCGICGFKPTSGRLRWVCLLLQVFCINIMLSWQFSKMLILGYVSVSYQFTGREAHLPGAKVRLGENPHTYLQSYIIVTLQRVCYVRFRHCFVYFS